MTGGTGFSLVLFLAAVLPGRDGKIMCLDPSGTAVDWFIVYKLPRYSKSGDQLIRDGVAHMYMDVNSQDFSRSTVSLKDKNQAVARTLQQIYDNYKSQEVVYVVYNDDFPEGDGKPRANGGHTKGDVAFDQKSGFWLIHSIPKFPRKPGMHGKGYVWPSSAGEFGQSMLCISMKTPEFRKVDLYSHWVAPALGDDMYAETWMRTGEALPSFCSGMYKVENIESVTFGGVLTFKSTKDHSKWAIGEHKKWTCIGDINRTKSQYKRGGGTVCFKNSAVWTAFNRLIAKFSKCDHEKR